MCEMIWKNLEEKNMKLLFSMMISFDFKYVLVSTGYGILLSFVYALVWLYNRK